MVVNDRLSELLRQSYAYLSRLPPYLEEQVCIDNKKAQLAIWHDVLNTGEHRIVVASYVPTFFRLGRRVNAEGFAVNEHNEKRSLTEDELDQFC